MGLPRHIQAQKIQGFAIVLNLGQYLAERPSRHRERAYNPQVGVVLQQPHRRGNTTFAWVAQHAQLCRFTLYDSSQRQDLQLWHRAPKPSQFVGPAGLRFHQHKAASPQLAQGGQFRATARTDEENRTPRRNAWLLRARAGDQARDQSFHGAEAGSRSLRFSKASTRRISLLARATSVSVRF